MSSFFVKSTELIIRVSTGLPPRPKFDFERSGHSTRDQINDSSLAAKDLGFPRHFLLADVAPKGFSPAEPAAAWALVAIELTVPWKFDRHERPGGCWFRRREALR